MPSNTQWYYSQGGQQLGPVSEAQLQQMKATGQVGPTDLVWSEGMIDWLPVGQVPQLQGPAAAQPAAPPMAQPAAPLPGQWSAQGTFHPQHGAYQQPGYAQPGYGGYSTGVGGQSQQTLAIVGFVFSIVFPIVGLILSIIALNGMKNSGNNEGKGFATAGLVISLILVVGGCLGFVMCGMLGQ
ncbi:MAG: antifreeze protein [Phycisphaerales bacterium]|nr:antifreeze protein [Phycisphaerales bacterium]